MTNENKVEVAEVVRHGEKITVPEAITLDSAIQILGKMRDEEEQVIKVRYEIQCHPADGAHAVSICAKELFGFMEQKEIRTMFGTIRPQVREFKCDVNNTVSVPWGQFAVPGVEGILSTGGDINSQGRLAFVLTGELVRKHKFLIDKLVSNTKAYLKEHSIFRGKQIKSSFEDEMDLDFVDVSKVREDDLIFSESVKKAIDVNVFTPVEKTSLCREHNIPLKRGVLLSGKFGTGKSMTAYVTAKKCRDNGWTFLYCTNPKNLTKALRFAVDYQPCVVFVEDIDKVVGGHRTTSMNDILNTLDGVETKDKEILTILTTNNFDEINQAMLRPGRLDAVIEVLPPDSEAVQRLIINYGKGKLAKGIALNKVGRMLQGQIPAVIREVLEKAKLTSIRNNGRSDMAITAQDLEDSAEIMTDQIKALNREPKKDPTPEELFGQGLGVALRDARDKERLGYDRNDTVEGIQDDAYDQGRDNGYDDGYDEGMRDGYQECAQNGHQD